MIGDSSKHVLRIKLCDVFKLHGEAQDESMRPISRVGGSPPSHSISASVDPYYSRADSRY